MIAYNDRDATRLIGKRSADIEALLGFRGRAEMIHRDDLVTSHERRRRQTIRTWKKPNSPRS